MAIPGEAASVILIVRSFLYTVLYMFINGEALDLMCIPVTRRINARVEYMV